MSLDLVSERYQSSLFQISFPFRRKTQQERKNGDNRQIISSTYHQSATVWSVNVQTKKEAVYLISFTA